MGRLVDAFTWGAGLSRGLGLQGSTMIKHARSAEDAVRLMSHLKAFYAAEKVGIFVCPGQWRYRLRRLNNEAHSASAHHSKKAASSNAASKPGPWRVELLKAKKL